MTSPKKGSGLDLLSPSCHVASILTALIAVNSWHILPMALPLARLEDITLRPDILDSQTEQAGDMLSDRVGGDSPMNHVAHHATRNTDLASDLSLGLAQAAQAIVDFELWMEHLGAVW